MPNAAHLGDPLEGTQPPGHDDWWLSLSSAANSDEERETIEHNRQLLLRFAAAFRTRYYVSCWHMNAEESSTMWARYTRQPESVAIQTTFAQLRGALPPYVGMGMVRYMNYATERLPTLNMFEYITHKNQCFEYERELRAVAMHPIVEGLDRQHFQEHHYQSEHNPSLLVYAPLIDLAIIESVVLHPSASKAFAEQVTSLCRKSNIPPPQQSALEPPHASAENAC
ncbi:hypothetical protein [Polaromonas sp. YR568]|uniref:hypothetical protein n=1 Tax=Polaromonas sp. YR568 TaxID=1855301 RepID=UPI00398BCE53